VLRHFCSLGQDGGCSLQFPRFLSVGTWDSCGFFSFFSFILVFLFWFPGLWRKRGASLALIFRRFEILGFVRFFIFLEGFCGWEQLEEGRKKGTVKEREN
jgi:hypothetical protein